MSVPLIRATKKNCARAMTKNYVTTYRNSGVPLVDIRLFRIPIPP